jgi:hypothetical protein
MGKIRAALKAVFVALGIAQQQEWPAARRHPTLGSVVERTHRDAVKNLIARNVDRIRELKGIRGESGQPRWGGTTCGLELEERKGLATILCLARARARGRRHVVPLPRHVALPASRGRRFGTQVWVRDQAQLDEVCDKELAALFPLAEVPPAA